MIKKTLFINNSAKTESIRTYHLIQYTPHIHFQHYENGACLRSSEVKPKLDKFILSFCQRHSIVLSDQCFVESPDMDKTALAYKLQIYPKNPANVKKKTPDARHDGFLGNQDSDIPVSKKIKTVYYPDGLCLSTISKDIRIKYSDGRKAQEGTLSSLIDYILPAFFLLHCFGARSTKGYGSYAIKGKELWKCKRDEKNVIGGSYLKEFIDVYYMIEFPRNIRRADMVKKAILISNMMKSGYNMTFSNPRDYYKGRIFRYFSEERMGGDKAFIKQHVLKGRKDRNPKSEDHKKYGEFRFVRSMLGLGQEISFKKGCRAGRTAVITDSMKNVNSKITEVADIQIIRFNNPVHFVPNGNYLLIVPSEIPKIMSNRVFSISDKDDDSISEEILTPELVGVGCQDLRVGKFNLLDFLDEFMNDFNAQTEFYRDKNTYKEPIDRLFIGTSSLSMIKVD